jgi:hypothetical protein
MNHAATPENKINGNSGPIGMGEAQQSSGGVTEPLTRRMPGEVTRLCLEGTLTIKSVSETRDKVLAAIEDAGANKQPLEIEISDDCDCDLTLPQLLLAARATAEVEGVELSIRAGEEGAFAVTLERAGFTFSGADGLLSSIYGDKS